MIDRIPTEPPHPGAIITIVPGEFEAAAWLAAHRWPNGFVCRSCGGGRATHLRCRPRVWQCSCGAFNSVTAGTVLHSTRLPLGKVMLACILLAQPGSISANRLRKVLGVRYETAWRLAHRLRLAVGLARVRIEQPVVASTISVPKRRVRGELTDRIRVWGVFDGAGRAAVLVGDRDLVLPRQRMLEVVAPGACAPHDLPTRPGCLEGLRRMILSTHHRVSRRWSSRYARAWAWLEGRGDRLCAMVRTAMGVPPHPWRRIPPCELLPPAAM